MEHGRGAVDPLTTIRTVAETGSTNADMLALAAAGAEEGLWLRAERQSAGRGRQGREWVSPVGNLYASTLVRLRAGDPAVATLALVAGVALAEVIGATLAHARHGGGLAWADAPRAASDNAGADSLHLKWPNDLLLAGAKLSGILLERAGDAVVIGFGVNVAHHPDLPARPTTNLSAHGVAVGAAELLSALADRFAEQLGRWRTKGLDSVRERWLALAHPPGTPLTARLPDGTALDGTFDSLASDGALLLRLADGSRRVIHAGDVFSA